MGAEQEKQAENKIDPLVELVEFRFKQIDAHEETRSQALLEQQKGLQATKSKLEATASEERAKGTPQGLRRASKLDLLIPKIDERILKISERLQTVESNANTSETKVFEFLEKRALKLETRGGVLREKDTEAQALAQELETLKTQKAELENKVNAASDVKERAPLESSLADVLEKIEKLESQDRGSEKMERAKELRAVREQREAEEHAREVSEQNEKVDAFSKTEGVAEPVEAKSLGEGMSKNFENSVKGLLEDPPDFEDMLGQAEFGLQKAWLRIVWAMSSKEITWDSKLNDSQKSLLSDMGIEFKHDAKSGFSTIKWGPTSETFAGVPAQANAVLKNHFGDSWYTVFKELTTKTTFADLEKQIDPQKTDEKTIGLRAFVEQMKTSGAKADSPVIEWLVAKHSSLEKPKKTPANS